jgi:hypothetical protein
VASERCNAQSVAWMDKALRPAYIGRVRGKRLAGACVVAVLGVLGGAPSALGCSCAPQPPAQSLREADGAVVGRLVRVLPHGPLHAVYRYEVLHTYKGGDAMPAGKMLDVHGSRRAAACALPRRTGRSYGLFLSQRHGRWFGGICGVVSPRRLRLAAENQPRVYRRSAGQGTGVCGAA